MASKKVKTKKKTKNQKQKRENMLGLKEQSNTIWTNNKTRKDKSEGTGERKDTQNLRW